MKSVSLIRRHGPTMTDLDVITLGAKPLVGLIAVICCMRKAFKPNGHNRPRCHVLPQPALSSLDRCRSRAITCLPGIYAAFDRREGPRQPHHQIGLNWDTSLFRCRTGIVRRVNDIAEPLDLVLPARNEQTIPSDDDMSWVISAFNLNSEAELPVAQLAADDAHVSTCERKRSVPGGRAGAGSTTTPTLAVKL
jgi:hypothetical protein